MRAPPRGSRRWQDRRPGRHGHRSAWDLDAHLPWHAVSMRVRFAPSPTGALHIGGARTALYNWLLARGHGAEYVLRIEDTDRERSTPENVEQIFEALRWLELDWDGDPVFQSERGDRHAEVVQQLIDSGYAYRSTAGPNEVQEFKATHGERGFRGEDEGTGAV